ncbi:MAG: glycosyltransferase family 4 protein, partial [Rhodospirillaceae bacterium]|nr:glycosyltransferase family 4 protein [Rhodospirillaceae bacterium]
MADADIVQFHFWNNPDIHAVLRSPMPAMRVVVWCHVNGLQAPHVVPRALFAFADKVVATTPLSVRTPAFREAPADRVACIPGGIDLDRLAGIEPAPHDRFTIGYVGPVELVKLHPDFVALCRAVRVPRARFLVAGEGTDRANLIRAVEAEGDTDRFSFPGFVPDIRNIHALSDIFGYSLSPDNTTTSDLALQEAMAAGVPPVVLPHGGAAALVRDGETGIVAGDTSAYSRAIERLYDDRPLRMRLGRAAAQFARANFDARLCAARFDAVYDELMAAPKRRRAFDTAGEAAVPPAWPGAAALIRSLDRKGDAALLRSVSAATVEAGEAADRALATMNANLG